jgi:hypothetical protein
LKLIAGLAPKKTKKLELPGISFPTINTNTPK